MNQNPKSKILVIDTEEYAGNFERQMCAYITGQIGECGVGKNIANIYHEEIKNLDWWKKHISQESDDNGVYRPASVWITEGWFNNGLGGHFKDISETENKVQIEMIKKRILDNNFETEKNGWTKENCENHLKKFEEDIKNASTLNKYPAYMSVAIFVDEIPPKEVLDEFKQRAQYFAENYSKIINKSYINSDSNSNIVITGFRQIEPIHKFKSKKIK